MVEFFSVEEVFKEIFRDNSNILFVPDYFQKRVYLELITNSVTEPEIPRK